MNDYFNVNGDLEKKWKLIINNNIKSDIVNVTDVRYYLSCSCEILATIQKENLNENIISNFLDKINSIIEENCKNYSKNDSECKYNPIIDEYLFLHESEWVRRSKLCELFVEKIDLINIIIHEQKMISDKKYNRKVKLEKFK